MPDTSGGPDLGDLVMRAAHGLRHAIAGALDPFDLSPHQARALDVVDRLDGPRVGEVAHRLRVSPRAATEVVDALEERGLVERVPDPHDRRATCVRLTGAGGDVLAEVNASRRDSARSYFAALDDEQRRQLAAALSALDAAHGRPEHDRRGHGGHRRHGDRGRGRRRGPRP